MRSAVCRSKSSQRGLRQKCDRLRFRRRQSPKPAVEDEGGMMDILVVQGAAPRRVAVAQYSAGRAQSNDEQFDRRGQEILQFITKKSEAPSGRDRRRTRRRATTRAARGDRRSLAGSRLGSAAVGSQPGMAGDWLQEPKAAKRRRADDRSRAAPASSSSRRPAAERRPTPASRRKGRRYAPARRWGARETMAEARVRKMRPDFIV